jgi:hypothetical protein
MPRTGPPASVPSCRRPTSREDSFHSSVRPLSRQPHPTPALSSWQPKSTRMWRTGQFEFPSSDEEDKGSSSDADKAVDDLTVRRCVVP